MGLLDNVTANLDSIAGKVGMTPDQVKAIMSTLQAKVTELGGDRTAALKATAAKHGIPVDKLQELVSHGDLAGQAAGLVGGLFKSN